MTFEEKIQEFMEDLNLRADQAFLDRYKKLLRDVKEMANKEDISNSIECINNSLDICLMNRWNKCEDKMPSDKQTVLTYGIKPKNEHDDSPPISTAIFNILDNGSYEFTTDHFCESYRVDYITHWMNLPLPPDDSNNADLCEEDYVKNLNCWNNDMPKEG